MDLLEMTWFLKTLEEKAEEIRKLGKREELNGQNGRLNTRIILEVLEEKIMSYRADETH